MQGPRSHTFPKPHVMLPRPPRRVGRCRGATAITERVHLRAEMRTGAAGRGRSHRSKSPDTRRHRHWAWSPTAGPERKTARSGQGEWRGAGKLAGSAWGWEARPRSSAAPSPDRGGGWEPRGTSKATAAPSTLGRGAAFTGDRVCAFPFAN